MAGLPLEPLARRADPLAGFAPMRGDRLGVAAVVGGNIGVNRGEDGRLIVGLPGRCTAGPKRAGQS